MAGSSLSETLVALGDQIVVQLTAGGTLQDGTQISIRGTDWLTVSNDQIVKLVQDFEPTQMDVLVAALRDSVKPE